MIYSPLLSINLKHTYYADGKCPDFLVSPAAQTLRLLNNHRCVIKPFLSGAKVFVATDKQQPLIPFSEKDSLLFDFKQQTESFALYSDQRIGFSIPNEVSLYQGGVLAPAGQGIPTVPNVNNSLFTLGIKRNFNQLNTLPAADEIQFFAKPVLWFYYVVTDPNNNDKMSIVDAGNEPKTTWQRLNPITEDSIYTQLVEQYPGKAIVCFFSEQTLTCQEACTKHFQLKQSDIIIFDQLPCPSYRNYFQLIPKAGLTTTEAIYEIVTVFSNTH